MATYVVHLRLTEQGARDIQKAVDYFDLNKQGLGPLMVASRQTRPTPDLLLVIGTSCRERPET